ncbi:MAG: asparagine synthase (glutamine-hydrolyzing) [Bdellovibrionaceae bacterium]|nr:asparagine synthase (glutamine-hydrolyzing) [Pseudobdellovibrionaceae bacterium]|tara:strand:- start:502 stop:2415 length:1914 start_codon:yes stop_codon:yes gene_type:complete
MCGIVGVLHFKNSTHPIDSELLDQMRDTMIHRGPDGFDSWWSFDRKIGFGHRRLSIIDLSETATQPMRNDDQSVVLTYNGEIYNHAEIRKEIQEIRDFEWKTDHSDTEVLLRAYETWGEDCLEKFRGIFSFAIWNEKKQKLWLVRDRVGVKPLYYSIYNGKITFASEIKALLKDPELKREVDEEALYDYLSFLTTPAPKTLFKGIYKLPGGTSLSVDLDGNLEEKRYWDAFDETELNQSSEAEIAKDLLSELKKSVSLRKASDVPVGVFLSGGIDSSTNAALFSEGETSPIQTFTIGYEGNYESYSNENHYAKMMAKEVSADYHEKLLNEEDLFEFLPKMIELQDEPIADPVCMPVYFVSKLAKDAGVTVCQVGEGADELFWGYAHWKILHRLQKLNDIPFPKILKKLGLKALSLFGQKYTYPYEFLRRGIEGERVFWGGAEALPEALKKKLLSKRLKEKFKNHTSWSSIDLIYQRFKKNNCEPSILNWMIYLDLNLRLPELLLMRVDKMSMGVSLEGRVPFLDHVFIKKALSIPESIKIKNGVSKSILKKAVRGLIPDELIDRKKQGFGVPVREWLLGRLGDLVRDELRVFCRTSGLLDESEVMKYLDEPSTARHWYLYNLALWHKVYIRQEELDL